MFKMRRINSVELDQILYWIHQVVSIETKRVKRLPVDFWINSTSSAEFDSILCLFICRNNHLKRIWNKSLNSIGFSLVSADLFEID